MSRFSSEESETINQTRTDIYMTKIKSVVGKYGDIQAGSKPNA